MVASSPQSISNNLPGPVPDGNGVMMYNYGEPIGVVYNPTVVAAFGLQYNDNYRQTGDVQARQLLINTADWLMKNAVRKEGGRYSLWEYGFKWKWYGGIEPPYSSALAQAEGINVLMLANEITGHNCYLSEARKAFGSFLVDYDQGGVASDEGRDSIFLQLLAKPGFAKTYVLNGHTNSLIHIWKYYHYTHDYRALIVFGKGVHWLVADDHLQKYYTGDWSYYDQMSNRAQENYHHGHIDQLSKLYEITEEQLLREYSDKFSACVGKARR